VNDPLSGHPQVVGAHLATRPERVSPGGVHLDRHREQRPSQGAQRTGCWHDRIAGLATATAATADAPVVG
jgi:hypothetical protein